MKTLLTRSAAEAAAYIRGGRLVAFPTETVYGLGADVFDQKAIARIFEAKMRPSDNPLIAHISRPDEIGDLAAEVSESAVVFIQEFFPGPLTVVLKRSERVPLIATAGLDTIGIRMPSLPLANEFLRSSGGPVAAPSANLSGRPSPTTWQAVAEDLEGRIDCILQGELTQIGLESTVVDCTGDVPILLREGAVSYEELAAIIPDTLRASSASPELNRSPGTRHRHYSPSARVELVEPHSRDIQGGNAAWIGLSRPPEGMALVCTCRSNDDYARELFRFFREADSLGIPVIYCEAVGTEGIGAALMDRIRRAEKG